MKNILWLLLCPLAAFADNINKDCPQFVYKSAPIVAADQHLCYAQFAVAYSYKTKTPIYTVEYLEVTDTGDEPRINNFRPDPKVPKKHRATLADYKGTTTECGGGRCDRGHMVPNQNLSSCAKCADESFYLTNIVPQNYKNNQVIWKSLETKVRDYVAEKNPVYVITGTIYLDQTPITIGKGVAVPDSLFKVIIDATTGKSIAFVMNNKAYKVGELAGKVVPLSKIENSTGITFPSSLNKIKSSSYQAWFVN